MIFFDEFFINFFSTWATRGKDLATRGKGFDVEFWGVSRDFYFFTGREKVHLYYMAGGRRAHSGAP